MATIACAPQAQNLNRQIKVCGPRQCVKGDPKDTVPVPVHQPLEKALHTTLLVQGPVSPGPKRFSVNVLNGFNGKKASVTVRSIDTIAKVQQRVLKLNPDLIGGGILAYNGKPTKLSKTMSELQVKPGATFITYQKCHGG